MAKRVTMHNVDVILIDELEKGWIMVNRRTNRLIYYSFSTLRKDCITETHKMFMPHKSRKHFLRLYRPVKAIQRTIATFEK